MAAAEPFAPPLWRQRPPRSAKERRAQALRAEGRVVQHLLRCIQELSSHRGCRPTQLGTALADLLKVSPAPAATLHFDCATQTNSNDEKVTQAPLWKESTTLPERSKELAAQTTTSKDNAVQTNPKEALTEADVTSRVTLASAEEQLENVLRAAPADQTCNLAVTEVVKCEKPQFLLAQRIAAPAADLVVSETEPVDNDAIECFEPSAWPHFPYFGVRVAIPDRDKLVFGTLTEVWRTVQSQEIVYFLRFDDGDVQHLSTSQAIAASARAQRYDEGNAAEAQSLTSMDTSAHAQSGSSSRTLTRQSADAHLKESPKALPKAKPVKGIKRGFLL